MMSDPLTASAIATLAFQAFLTRAAKIIRFSPDPITRTSLVAPTTTGDRLPSPQGTPNNLKPSGAVAFVGREDALGNWKPSSRAAGRC
jgi:hypothetical protein